MRRLSLLLSHRGRHRVGVAVVVAAVASAAVTAAVMLTGGGGASASDALVLTPGARQVFGVPNLPGRPVTFAGDVLNRTKHSVPVERAQLITFPGHPAPSLVGAAIEPHGRDYYSGRGWPVTEVANEQLPATVPPGRSVVLFAVTGDRLGVDYLTLGVRLYYRQTDGMHSVDVYVGGVDCVRPRAVGAACGPEDDVVLDEVDKRSKS